LAASCTELSGASLPDSFDRTIFMVRQQNFVAWRQHKIASNDIHCLRRIFHQHEVAAGRTYKLGQRLLGRPES
jgi:hypothetical protein